MENDIITKLKIVHVDGLHIAGQLTWFCYTDDGDCIITKKEPPFKYKLLKNDYPTTLKLKYWDGNYFVFPTDTFSYPSIIKAVDLRVRYSQMLKKLL